MRTHAWVLGLLLALGTSAAYAQSGEAERKVARELGTQGIAAYDAGNYPDAVDKLSRAYAVLKAPTLGLWLARSLERTGRLVEASERYQEVVRMPLDSNAPPQFREAVESAEKELAALDPRIPALTIKVENAAPEAAAITVDGKPVKAAMVGLPLPVDPGEHRVDGHAGEARVSRVVAVVEGKRETVTLSFPTRVGGPTATPSSAPAGLSGSESTTTPSTKGGHEMRRTAGYVALGVGGVGVVVGSIAGFMALGKKGKLDDDGCRDAGCPTRLDDERKSYNSLRPVSTLGFVVGGVAAAGGAALLLTAPSRPRQVGLWIGAGSAGLKGAF